MGAAPGDSIQPVQGSVTTDRSCDTRHRRILGDLWSITAFRAISRGGTVSAACRTEAAFDEGPGEGRRGCDPLGGESLRGHRGDKPPAIFCLSSAGIEESPLFEGTRMDTTGRVRLARMVRTLG